MKITGNQGDRPDTGSAKPEIPASGADQRSLTGFTSTEADNQRLQTIEGNEQDSAANRGEDLNRDDHRPDPGTEASAAFDQDSEPRAAEPVF